MSAVAERLRRSLAVRLPRLYEALLTARRPARRAPKPPLPLTLLTFCGVAQLPLLRESIHSLYRAWPALPELVVVSDGSLNRTDLEDALSWWPGRLRLGRWEHSVAALRDPRVAAFSAREISGRKLAAILDSARRGPTLFVDSDVLWFRFPERLRWLLESSSARPALLLSEDIKPSYDPVLVRREMPELERPPFYCCGFGYAAGDLLGACDLDRLLDHAATHGRWFTEQTLFAAMARQIAPEPWPADEVACSTTDWNALRPTFRNRSWAARHYVQPVRHLFWLDALALHLRSGADDPGGEEV